MPSVLEDDMPEKLDARQVTWMVLLSASARSGQGQGLTDL